MSRALIGPESIFHYSVTRKVLYDRLHNEMFV